MESANNESVPPDNGKKGGIFGRLKEFVLRIFGGHDKKSWLWISAFLAVTVATIYLLYKQFTDEKWLFSIVIQWFVVPLRQLGEWGWVIYIIFMGVQGILMPIPSELVLLSSGIIWNLWPGTVLGIIGSMFAGILTYYLSLKGGRPLAERLVGAENIELVDKYIEKYGGLFIFVARAFPFIAFDPISYASGLVKIKPSVYIAATFVGSIIRCFFYAFLGASLLGEGIDMDYLIAHPDEMNAFIESGAARFNTMFLIIVVVIAGLFLLYQFVLVPYLRKKRDEIAPKQQ